MKNLGLFVFSLLIPLLTEGQKFSNQSKPVSFQIPQSTGTFTAVSAPVEMKIRQGVTFSNVSQPTEFTIRQKQGLPNNSEARNIKEEQTLNTSIPELEEKLPKYYSLIIGINDYIFSGPPLQDLRNAISDASKLKKALTENFAFQVENSIFLENPTRQQIIQQLDNLVDRITSKDNLLIFYAGHGVWDEKIKVGYWLPADAKTGDKSGWISNSTIRDYIAGINSKHTLLITDACFSGGIFRTREMDLSDYAMSNLYRLPSRKAMTSGTLTTVPDESKFMHYFLKRLSDTQGKYLSGRQIFYGLETAVLNNTSTVPQFGVIQDTGDEGGDFIFIRK